jgi:hypothetical protein
MAVDCGVYSPGSCVSCVPCSKKPLEAIGRCFLLSSVRRSCRSPSNDVDTLSCGSSEKALYLNACLVDFHPLSLEDLRLYAAIFINDNYSAHFPSVCIDRSYSQLRATFCEYELYGKTHRGSFSNGNVWRFPKRNFDHW